MPTFWLPSFDTHRGTYVIVKFGGMFGPHDIDTCFKLCQYSGANVMMAESSPDSRVYDYFYIDEINCEPQLTVGIPNADKAWGEDRMFTCPGYEDGNGRITGDSLSLLGEGFLSALEASKSFQFEGKLQFA